MSKQNRARAEIRAEQIASELLNKLRDDFQVTNYSGRFNDQDHITIRVTNGRDIQGEAVCLKISADDIQLGKSTQGKAPAWKSVSEDDLPKKLNTLCQKLALA